MPRTIPRAALYAPALFLLAVHPAIWLAKSWFDAGYDSDGEWVFAVVAGLFLISATSRRVQPTPQRDLRLAIGLEFGTAAIRVIGELMAVHTIGALALVVDVYALGLGAGLKGRQRSMSPAGLASLFALSLPIERLIQRGLGYPMQLASAGGACAVLEPLHPALSCEGTLIRLGDQALSVDLPCSGARGLVLLAAMFLALVATRYIRGRRVIAGAIAVVIGAYAANTLRLVVLAEGLLLGADVVAEPLHSIVGLVCLLLGAMPILILTSSPISPAPCENLYPTQPGFREYDRPIAAALLIAALLVLIVPAKPIDVSAAVTPAWLPVSLDDRGSEPIALSPREAAYFTKFGGSAAKRRYWGAAADHTVVVVRTKAPLRHLHAPDECLIGAGHRVKLLGVRSADGTSVYRSEDPNGDVWRVEVSYRSSDGTTAISPAEVSWRWIQRPHTSWTMVERITPWRACETTPSTCTQFDQRLFQALEVRG